MTKTLFGSAVVGLLLAGSTAHAGITTGWANNATGGAPVIQEFDLNTGIVLKEFTAPRGNNGRGIVQVGNTIYYTSAYTNGVFAYDFTTNTDLGTLFTVNGASGLSTMAYDGVNFYIGDYSGTNNVYKYSPTGTLLATITLKNCTSYCNGLEYANGTLISNRGDTDTVYDVYALDGTLLQSAFITSPSAQSTGIAYDGTYYYTTNMTGGVGVGFNKFDSTGVFLSTTLYIGGTRHVGEDLSVNYAERPDTGVPEPASWALMISGFGMVGFAARRGRKVIAA